MASRTSRICSGLVVAGLGAFVLLTALAAAAYPGGTFCEPGAQGYRFWGNFFCDLTQRVTQQGVDNSRARSLAEASFVAISLALAPFFWLLGGIASRPRIVRGLGLVSALGTNVVAWLPSGMSPLLHQAAVFAATIPGLAASLLGFSALVVRALSGGAALRTSALLGSAMLLFAISDAVGYAYAITVPAQCYRWLPALQKVAALFLLSWMTSIAWLGWKNRTIQ